MKRNWSIIPEFEQREQFFILSEQYQTAFEYNDFYVPSVYQNEEEVEKICYKNFYDRYNDKIMLGK